MRLFGMSIIAAVAIASVSVQAQQSDDPCDPNYAGYHVNAVTAELARQQCDTNRRQQQQADAALLQQQAAEQAAQVRASEIASEQ